MLALFDAGEMVKKINNQARKFSYTKFTLKSSKNFFKNF
jgi:hypothetical protein